MALVQSTGRKIELETVGDRDEEKVIDKLLQKAVLNVFNRHFALHEFDELLAGFDNGLKIEVGDSLPSLDYVRQDPAPSAAVIRPGFNLLWECIAASLGGRMPCRSISC